MAFAWRYQQSESEKCPVVKAIVCTGFNATSQLVAEEVKHESWWKQLMQARALCVLEDLGFFRKKNILNNMHNEGMIFTKIIKGIKGALCVFGKEIPRKKLKHKLRRGTTSPETKKVGSLK